ncbi:MAG: hypothetical protein ABI947_29465 [Chloroflexota bacterium]
MEGVDPEAFKYALSKVLDGNMFEEFAQNYLGKVLGYEFAPVGGFKDRGIDGLEHLFHRKGFERSIYQISIEQNPQIKLDSTLKKLHDNNIDFDQLYFVTNRQFPDQDIAIDKLFEKYKKPIHIYDLRWLSNQVNMSQSTVNTYRTFIDSYLHEFSKPGKSYEIGDLVNDPRLFVFLRQQWDDNHKYLQIDEILADTLIIYALEGTDADKKIFKTEEEIKPSHPTPTNHKDES